MNSQTVEAPQSTGNSIIDLIMRGDIEAAIAIKHEIKAGSSSRQAASKRLAHVREHVEYKIRSLTGDAAVTAQQTLLAFIRA